ncbi:MAG: TatD family hydrolase [Planctomycetota bacterium]|jgi:TatD DNase family protein
MELIDTHCHLTFDDLAHDIDGVLARSRAAGVTAWITVGTDMNENQKAVEFSNRFENMYAAVAVHPHDAKTVTGETIARLEELAQNPKVVAIGETGLDYHYNHSLHHDQRRVFAQHLKIAADCNLPVIIHCRKAFDETLDVVEQYGSGVKGIVFHCFSGSAEQAEILIPKGYYFSFTGVVTFKNAEKTRKAAAVVPVERLILETDCPYMSPEPMRKQKVNEPALMFHTAKFLADLKNMALEDFAAATTASAKAFFNLPSCASS